MLVRVLAVTLVALVVHTLADGKRAPAAVAEAILALLLLASVLVWRQGRRFHLPRDRGRLTRCSVTFMSMPTGSRASTSGSPAPSDAD